MANKITRHNHPLMVGARRESYRAGYRKGYEEGRKQGFLNDCTALHHYYKTLIHALELKVEAVKLHSYEDGFKDGIKAARGGDT